MGFLRDFLLFMGFFGWFYGYILKVAPFGEAVAFQPWRNMPSSFLPTWLEYAWVRWFASGPCQTLLGLRHFCEESFPSSSRCTRFHKAGWGESFWIVCWYEAVWRRLRTFCVWTSIFFCVEVVCILCGFCVDFVWNLCGICVGFVCDLCVICGVLWNSYNKLIQRLIPNIPYNGSK